MNGTKYHYLQARYPDGSLARYSSPRKADADRVEASWRRLNYTEITRWYGRVSGHIAFQEWLDGRPRPVV